jgi:2,5-furandicarboxylate decarboxylase 1
MRVGLVGGFVRDGSLYRRDAVTMARFIQSFRLLRLWVPDAAGPSKPTANAGSSSSSTASEHTASRTGLYCTIPISPSSRVPTSTAARCSSSAIPPPDVVVFSEAALTTEMAAYRPVYGAFSNLRHQLGRCDDEPWYRYTFSDTDFAVDVVESLPSNLDAKHRP